METTEYILYTYLINRYEFRLELTINIFVVYWAWTYSDVNSVAERMMEQGMM